MYYDEAFRNYTIGFKHQMGFTNTNSIAWEIFRCRADEDKSIRFNRLCYAIKMLTSGEYSIREVAKETRYSPVTIMRLLRKILAKRERDGLGDILCPCGKPIQTHKQWCSFRFLKSDKRQLFIKNLTDSQIKNRSNYDNRIEK